MLRFPKFRLHFQELCQLAVVMSCGDLIAQRLEGHKWEWYRTLRYSAVGFCFLGPPIRYWYDFLEENVPKQQFMKRAAKKMLLDQFVFDPLFSLCVMGVYGITNRDSKDRFLKRYTEDWPRLLKMNYCIWPAVQVVNFAIIPHRFQLLFVQTIAVAWNSFVSQIVNRKSH